MGTAICTGCYLSLAIYFFCRSRTCIHIQMVWISSHKHTLFLNGLGYLFFFGSFRVIPDMLCTRISQAVAPTQSHIFYFIVFCFSCACLPFSHNVSRSFDGNGSASRSRYHSVKKKTRGQTGKLRSKDSAYAVLYNTSQHLPT